MVDDSATDWTVKDNSFYMPVTYKQMWQQFEYGQHAKILQSNKGRHTRYVILVEIIITWYTFIFKESTSHTNFAVLSITEVN